MTSLLAVVAALLVFAAPASAITGFTVDDASDTANPTADGLCDAPGADTCTLREAILESNMTMATVETIAFSLPSGTTIQLSSDMLTITDPVIISGNGTANTNAGFTGLTTVPNPIVDANDHKPFDVMSGGTTIKGLNIQDTAADVPPPMVPNVEPNMITLRNAGGNHIEGNFIGTNRAGDADAGNGGAGIVIESGNANVIGGSNAGQRNLISASGDPLQGDPNNLSYGIWVKGGSTATIAGNLIGTAANGTDALGNELAGVRVGGQGTAAPNTTVGGTGPTDGNVLSGNGNPQQGYGVFVGDQAGTGIKILGNRIGTDVAGTGDLGNNPNGIELLTDSAVQVGDALGHGNLISGNALYGINVESPNHTIQGNKIGTNAAGTGALENNQSGIYVNGQENTTIGGTTAGARNLISGNGTYGIRFAQDASNSHVQGNYIGTDADGTATLPNGSDGVYFEGGTGNVVGGPDLGDGGNLITGNNGNGIRFDKPEFGPGTSESTIQGNFIGPDKDGNPVGNDGDGVRIVNGANNTIGGIGAVNVISFNGGAGVSIKNASGTTPTGNLVSRNSIGGNNTLGIDLSPDTGVTANDAPPDADTGANQLQNFPVLHSALPIPSTTVAGTLLSTPNTAYTIEFFKVDACDVSGNGEGEVFMGVEHVTTDNVGYAIFTHPLSPAVQNPHYITATATDPDGNTSEFSPCRLAGTFGDPQARPPDPPPTQTQTQTQTTPPPQIPNTPARKCKDKKKPITTLKRGGLGGIGGVKLTLDGKSRDPKPCVSGLRKVQVSLARVRGRTGTNCRFIRRPNRYTLTDPQNCRRPVLFEATGLKKWTFTFPVDLKPGLYRVQARATDKAGNKETPKKGRNIVFFSVP
jgi:hypothetical protein